MTDKNYKWRRIGGGTSLIGDDEYPCDDQYEHEDTKKTFVVICTQDAHTNLPHRVRKPSDLRRWVGVKSVSTPEAPKGKTSGPDEQERTGTAEASPPIAAPVAELRVGPGAA